MEELQESTYSIVYAYRLDTCGRVEHRHGPGAPAKALQPAGDRNFKHVLTVLWKCLNHGS